MQLIYHAADTTEAHILAGLLRSHGIEAHVGGHYLQGGIGDLAPTDLAKLYVDEDDLEAARALIADYQRETPGVETPGVETPGDPTPSLSAHTPRALLLLLGVVLVAGLSYAIAW